MAELAFLCPSCRIARCTADCSQCGYSTAGDRPLIDFVAAATTRAQQAIDRGELSNAQRDLMSAVRLFPFMEVPLHLLLRLSVECGRFMDARTALAWLSPLLNGSEVVAANDLIESSVNAYNTVLTGSLPEAGHRTALVAHLALLTGQRIPASPAQDETRGKPISIGRVVIYGILGIMVVVTIVSEFMLMRTRTERDEFATAVSEHETTNAELTIARDSLNTVVHASTSMTDSLSTDIEVLQERTDNLSATVDRLAQAGPHAAYHMLGLASRSDPDRIGSMELFVSLFPNADCYTGFFLRELFDRYDASRDVRTAATAERLREYCASRPKLSYLMSARITHVLSGEATHDEP